MTTETLSKKRRYHGIRRNDTYITCKTCGKEFKSLGFARHRAMHYDKEQIKIRKIKT